MKKLIYILLAALALTACGKKGPLIPPEALVPAAVANLQVQQQAGDFRVSWSAPTKEQGGRPLRDLAGFQLLRRQLLPGDTDCAACPDAWQLLTAVDLDLPAGVQRSGDLYIYLDRAIKPTTSNQYRLLATSRSGGVSRPATSALKKIHPPPPPPLLTATATPATVRLELAPGGEQTPAAIGFNIYRRLAGKEPQPLPLNPAPVTGPVWEDQRVEYGATYRYAATAVVRIDGDTVESSPSAEVEVVFTLPELR